MASMTVTIIETLSDNRFVLNCARCGCTGRGYYSNGEHSTEPCKVCGGRGALLVKLNSGSELPFVRCARCEGTGRGYYSNGALQGLRRHWCATYPGNNDDTCMSANQYHAHGLEFPCANCGVCWL